MSIETEIQTEVDALKARFDDTKMLYREVCALLFFRYGITPTTNKLYQFVRKGSMSAPADALTKFWDELRSKARVEIDHPDLPPELKATAAEAIASLWRQAAAAARGELAELRLEVEAELQRTQAEVASARQAAEEVQAGAAALKEQLAGAHEQGRALAMELEAERRAHAGTAARLQELQRHGDELRAQQERQRADFSADLAKARESVEQANSRADASERRALLEIDQERQGRAKVEKQLETLRGQLSAAESRHRDAALEHADSLARLQSQAQAAEAARARLEDANVKRAAEVDTLRVQLGEAERQALQAQTEAQTVRALLDRVAPAPADVHQPAQTPARSPKRKSP